MDEQRRAVELTVTGAVQGVGFRNWTRQMAERAGVAGWVRNNIDRTVSIYAEGTPEAVDGFIAQIQRGSGTDQAPEVRVSESTPQSYSGFSIEW